MQDSSSATAAAVMGENVRKIYCRVNASFSLQTA